MSYIDPRLRPSSSLPPVSSSPAQVDTAHGIHMAPPFSIQTLGTQQFNFPATYTFALPAVIGTVLAASGAPELPGASFNTPLSVLPATSSDPSIPAALDPPSAPAARKKAPSRKASTKKKSRGALEKAIAERLIGEKSATAEVEETATAKVKTKAKAKAKAKAKTKAKTVTTTVNAINSSTLISAAPDSSNPPQNPPQAPAVLEPQRLQRLRIPAASKEVVPLTSKKREATKENDGHRKKLQAQ